MLVTLVLWCFSVYGFTQGQFSGKNIALGKPATQYPGSLCFDNFCYDASLAVDGKIDDPDKWQGHCSHTLQQFVTNAYWMINFTDSYYITGVVVYNRIYDVSVARRLRGFKLFGVNTGQNSERLLYTYEYNFLNSTYPSKIEIPLPDKPYVSGIRIEIPYRGSSEPTLLALCEVEVYSDDVICPPLTLNNNTIASYTNNRYNGSIASFSCVEGYDLQYTENLLCHNEKWIGQTPECQSITSMVCQQDGTWNDTATICIPVTCDHPGKDSLLHGIYIDQSGNPYLTGAMNYLETIRVHCSTGYRSNSKLITRVCQHNGFWSGFNAECTIIVCQAPEITDDVRYEFTNNNTAQVFLFGTTVNISCNNGMLQSGSTVKRCTENGTWDGNPSTCKRITENVETVMSAVIVGAVLGTVVLLLLIVIVVRERRHKRIQKKENENQYSSIQLPSSNENEYDRVTEANLAV